MSSIIQAEKISKSFGQFRALDQVSFSVELGQIVGLIGPNGAGKTTLLRALLGLTTYQGQLDVLGLNPRKQRAQMMRRMCFIADVAILPRWMTVAQTLEFVAGVHPHFSMEKAEALLAKTDIPRSKKVSALSKGMVTQLHLAVVMAIDAEILVLDEPTLGLDILYRKMFYQQLLNDYFNKQRTIIVTTHQVEEIEDILTHIMMINRGHMLLDTSMDDIAKRFTALKAKADQQEALDALNPILKQQHHEEYYYLFEDYEGKDLATYGELVPPRVSDIFVAKVEEDRA